MTQISRDAPARSIAVIDSPKVLKYVILAIVFLAVGCLCFFAAIKGETSIKQPNEQLFSILMGCVFTVPFILAFTYFKIHKKGYVIDVENNIFEFPGGGIEADSWTSYFTLAYWLQGFKRHRIPLSAIREIQAYQDVIDSKYTDSQGRRRIRKQNKDRLDIAGDFGAISFDFSSKGKRDQLYSAIISLNKMGDPMLRR